MVFRILIGWELVGPKDKIVTVHVLTHERVRTTILKSGQCKLQARRVGKNPTAHDDSIYWGLNWSQLDIRFERREQNAIPLTVGKPGL